MRSDPLFRAAKKRLEGKDITIDDTITGEGACRTAHNAQINEYGIELPHKIVLIPKASIIGTPKNGDSVQKIIMQYLAKDLDLNEASMARFLQSEHFVKVERVVPFEFEGTTRHILLQENIGQTLESAMEHCTNPYGFIEQLLHATRALHIENRVVHRDLKPDNMLITKEGRVLLSDFQLATSIDDRLGQSMLTRGSSSYTKPIILNGLVTGGHVPADIANDMYALGVILYEMLEGRKPLEVEFYHDDNSLATITIDGHEVCRPVLTIDGKQMPWTETDGRIHQYISPVLIEATLTKRIQSVTNQNYQSLLQLLLQPELHGFSNLSNQEELQRYYGQVFAAFEKSQNLPKPKSNFLLHFAEGFLGLAAAGLALFSPASSIPAPKPTAEISSDHRHMKGIEEKFLNAAEYQEIIGHNTTETPEFIEDLTSEEISTLSKRIAHYYNNPKLLPSKHTLDTLTETAIGTGGDMDEYEKRICKALLYGFMTHKNDIFRYNIGPEHVPDPVLGQFNFTTDFEGILAPGTATNQDIAYLLKQFKESHSIRGDVSINGVADETVRYILGNHGMKEAKRLAYDFHAQKSTPQESASVDRDADEISYFGQNGALGIRDVISPSQREFVDSVLSFYTLMDDKGCIRSVLDPDIPKHQSLRF